jgi:hypothetical protein
VLVANKAISHYAAICERLPQQFIQGVPNGKLIQADRSGHDVARDQPKIVIDAIRDLERLSRDSNRR